MRELVRTLLLAALPRTPPLLIAPEETLTTLEDAAPDPDSRLALRVEGSAPHHQIAAGQVAGRFARQHGAGALHGHGLRYAPLFAAASVTSGLPLVVTLHNLVPTDLNGLQKAAARTALSRAHAVIAVSRAVADSAAGVVTDRERIVMIPNGIDITRFVVPGQEREARRQEARAALAIPMNAPVIVCLSRLSPEKDVSNLLEAFALVSRHSPEVRLLVAGEGRLRKTLEWHIELLGLQGKAQLLGAYDRERVPDLLFAADLFALSSREEGLSLAVLEAMAAGLPVVATNIGGLPEAVAANETGFLAPPRDPPAFAACLEALIADPDRRRAMGQAGARWVAERFTDTAMIAATFALYGQVASGR